MPATLFAIVLLGASARAGSWDTDVKAGAAKVVITPPISETGVPEYLDGTPVWMAGFSIGRAATALHDDLYARACVLDIQGTRLAFVTLDLVGYMVEEVQKTRRLLPPELGIDRLIVTSTHNHQGPDTMGLWGYQDLQWPFLHPGINNLYFLTLKRQIVEAVTRAASDLRFAGLRAATTSTEGLDLIRDSRDPIIIDEQLSVLQAVELGGDREAIFTMLNWSNHPEVLWSENTELTADYPKYVCDGLEERWGGTAIFVSGALGGLLTPNVSAHTFEEAERVGSAVASRATEALESSPELTLHTELDIRYNEAVDVFLANPMLRALNTLWRRSFRSLENCGPIGRVCRDVRTEVNLISIPGVIQIITVPGEIVPELSYDLLAKLDEPHGIIAGLGNDEVGYILPLYRYECSPLDDRDCYPTSEKDFKFPDNFLDPEDHYEETVSLGPEAAPVIMDAISDLVADYQAGR